MPSRLHAWMTSAPKAVKPPKWLGLGNSLVWRQSRVQHLRCNSGEKPRVSPFQIALVYVNNSSTRSMWPFRNWAPVRNRNAVKWSLRLDSP
jgi:hypothetical protein